MSTNLEVWWRAKKGEVNQNLRQYVRRIEQAQGAIFDRFVKLEVLYDPNSSLYGQSGEQLAHVEENAIASNVDTVTAVVAATEILARYQTDGADWGMQRLARHLEWYSEELAKDLKIADKCRSAFKECAKKGVGLTKAYIVWGQVRVERVFVENIVVPDDEIRGGRTPKQMHQWDYVDLEELCARFPKHEDAIIASAKNRRNWRGWSTGNLMGIDLDVELLESWRLPIGVKGQPGYKPGRHIIAIDGLDLLDEKYEDDCFPFAIGIWSERATSWYGISGAERIAGIQRALNRRNWQIERQNDQCALPTQYVRPVDAHLTVKSSRIGAIVPIKGDYPVSVTPVAVSGETYQNRVDLKESAGEEFGQSRMATHATKPAGIDSGVALREYKDQSTQRFALQEKMYEQLVLDTIWLAIVCCKKLGAKAPTMTRHARFGGRKIPWKEVNPRELKVQIAAASTLGRSPAGRKQMVIEFAQAGIVTLDEARALLRSSDLERALSLYTAALENIEYCIDQIADGAIVMPDPVMNLKMCVWRGQQELQIWAASAESPDGAPEERVEALRQFVSQAIWMMKRAEGNAANQNAMSGATAPPMPADPNMPIDQSMMPPVPMDGPGVAAFAPSAMNLRAS